MLKQTLRRIGCSFAVAIGLMATQASAATIDLARIIHEMA